MAVEVGSKYQGKVTGITHFGAFVELPGGETGMVHISEISDDYVKDIRDFLNVNDIVTVKVMNVASDGKNRPVHPPSSRRLRLPVITETAPVW